MLLFHICSSTAKGFQINVKFIRHTKQQKCRQRDIHIKAELCKALNCRQMNNECCIGQQQFPSQCHSTLCSIVPGICIHNNTKELLLQRSAVKKATETWHTDQILELETQLPWQRSNYQVDFNAEKKRRWTASASVLTENLSFRINALIRVVNNYYRVIKITDFELTNKTNCLKVCQLC